ncbi:hypothetical protein [Nocardioides albus]|uniref:Uncharacterized protein n=1 Tax=Nocardioides albus TaxID=1841 RepID=A0A7W5FA05_9ACTN|nr:hypothetical protein [Nocardioides albus]MBB3090612.1 hypothetical protein [Nocardioides albus]GGU25161.1 hypothetical protein GCM10007979_24960 [Nocardioides albus]
MSKKVQIWSRTISGQTHHLEVTGDIIRTFVWTVDDEEVLTRKTADDRARLESKEHGSLLVIHSGLGTPRRATYFTPDEGLAGMTGVGGVDLTPEPGSRAAAYERRVIEHPKRYALIETLGGVGGVIAGIVGAMVVAWIVSRISLPDIDLPLPNLPDLPDLPLPDLPSIPWPSIPWPDLPDVQVPEWVKWVANHLKYIWPVVLAFVLAQGEIKRRRKHAEASRTSAEASRTSAEKAADDASTDASDVSTDRGDVSTDRGDASTDRGDASTDAGDVSAEEGQRRGL